MHRGCGGQNNDQLIAGGKGDSRDMVGYGDDGQKRERVGGHVVGCYKGSQ